MKAITVYRSVDNVDFNTEEECRNYEILISKANKLKQMLGSRPTDDQQFTHGLDTISKYRNEVSDMCIIEGLPVDVCNGFRTCNNILLCYVSDADSPRMNIVNSLAWRLMCIDERGVEYEQPFFANEANKKMGYK